MTAQGGTGPASGDTYILAQSGNYTLSATCTFNGNTSSSSAPLVLQIRPGGFAITGVSTISCERFDEAKGGYRVQSIPQYAGQTSTPISFLVVNELATTRAPAPYSLRLYTDYPVATLVVALLRNQLINRVTLDRGCGMVKASAIAWTLFFAKLVLT